MQAKPAPENRALFAPRLLRRRGAGDRYRGTGADDLWRPGLCPARDRPQPLCGRQPEDQGRDFRRGTGRNPRQYQRSGGVFRPRGSEVGAGGRQAARNFFSLDATCPLVTKVHREAAIHFKRGREILLIGHSHHPEVVGTLGQLPPGAVTLIETAEDAATFTPKGSGQPRFRDPDHAVDRRHRRNRRGAEGSASRTSTGRTRKTSATPPPTASSRSRRWRRWSMR